MQKAGVRRVTSQEFYMGNKAGGVARNLFWGTNFYITILQSYTLTSSAAISAQIIFRIDLGVYIPIYYIGIYTPKSIHPVATALEQSRMVRLGQKKN